MSVNQGGGFVRSGPDAARVNLQLYFSPVSYTQTPLSDRKLLNPDPFSAFLLSFNSCRPTSRGHIRLASPDPLAHPVITANAYSTDHDVAEMLDAVKFLRTWAAQPPLARLIEEELRPGPECRTDDEMIADFRARSGTVYHPSCTCRMGPDPSSSVVDARLRVHGVAGLRVCDASVFPTLIAGNTNAPSMMVGWKGAEIILADQR